MLRPIRLIPISISLLVLVLIAVDTVYGRPRASEPVHFDLSCMGMVQLALDAVIVGAVIVAQSRRTRLRFPPLPRPKDPPVRTWVQMSVCLALGVLVSCITACWVIRVQTKAGRNSLSNRLRHEGFENAAERFLNSPRHHQSP